MKDEYISINEFAKRANVNRSYIYKILSTKLSTYVKQVDNKKMLNTRALELFELNQVDKEVDNFVYQGDNTKMLDFLMKQLEEKDKQIEKLQESLDHSQQLQAIAQKKIELLEQKKEEPGPPAEPSAEEEPDYIEAEFKEVETAVKEDLQSIYERIPKAPSLEATPEEIIEWKKARMKVLSKLNDRELALMGYRPSQRPIMKVASMYGKDEEDWDILKPSFLD